MWSTLLSSLLVQISFWFWISFWFRLIFLNFDQLVSSALALLGIRESLGTERSRMSAIDSTANSPPCRRMAGEEKECNTCMTHHGATHFPSPDELPEECSHCTDTCRTCIGASLASDIESKSFDRVGCPICLTSWDRIYIEHFSTEEVTMRYETIGMLNVLQATPNFRWCLSPHCKSGQINQEGDREPIVTCVACGFKMCFTHQIRWHSGFTCTQYDVRQTQARHIEARRTMANLEARAAQVQARLSEAARAEAIARIWREEQATQAALATHTKTCPRCDVRIEKSGGCEHMTCELTPC